MKRMLLFSLLMLLLSTSKVYAQEDSIFIANYKNFRQAVEPFSTYAFYLVPFESSEKIKLTAAYQARLAKVFHFLNRNKQISFQDPEFIVGILVDSVKTGIPKVTKGFRSGNFDNYEGSVDYNFTFTILIHTKNKEQLKFNFGGVNQITKKMTISVSDNHIRDSISRRGSSMPAPALPPFSSELLPPELKLTVDDYKNALFRIMDKYKNYYVDRVDN